MSRIALVIILQPFLQLSVLTNPELRQFGTGVTKLGAEVARIMRTPEVEKRVANDGYVLVLNTPAQFRSEIQAEVETWSRVIRQRGIRPE